MTDSREEAARSYLVVVGRRVRAARILAGLTQDELAEAAGMSRSFVSIIEHGTHGVDVIRLFRLATVLTVPLPELVDVAAAEGTDRTIRRLGWDSEE